MDWNPIQWRLLEFFFKMVIKKFKLNKNLIKIKLKYININKKKLKYIKF